VAAQWRLRRIWRMQTTALDLKMDQQEEWLAKTYDQISGTERTTIAFKSMADDGKSLELLLRYETACSRTHQRAMNSLFKLRKEKLRNDPEPPSEPEAQPRPSARGNDNCETVSPAQLNKDSMDPAEPSPDSITAGPGMPCPFPTPCGCTINAGEDHAF